MSGKEQVAKYKKEKNFMDFLINFSENMKPFENPGGIYVKGIIIDCFMGENPLVVY